MPSDAVIPAVSRLRGLTAARIGLGVSGPSIPTTPLLDFQLAHAQARDAVHHPLAAASLIDELKLRGHPPIFLRSAAADRAAYLRRPDLGRALDRASRETLEKIGGPSPKYDVAIVVADGLSALAVERHAIEVVGRVWSVIESQQLKIAPLVVVDQARVAIADEIAESLGAAVAVILIGERPGLSSPDSLGAYITYDPRPGRTDAERNCISNIRPEGLSYDAAAAEISRIVGEALRQRLTGVALNIRRMSLSAD